jgi:NAD-dependent DNA ligase
MERSIIVEIKKCPVCGKSKFYETNDKNIRCENCLSLIETTYRFEAKYTLKLGMDLQKLKTEISNCIYNAACIIEATEHLRLYKGNGHHAAQKIAEFAIKEFEKGL